jgi:hypothetical protein
MITARQSCQPSLIRELGVWLESLPRLAEHIPPVVQLHGYSGTWRIETRFDVWHGMPVSSPNEVYWYGFTFLFIPPGGRAGKDIMYGSAHVNWAGYRSRYDVINEVREATATATVRSTCGSSCFDVNCCMRRVPLRTSGSAVIWQPTSSTSTSNPRPGSPGSCVAYTGTPVERRSIRRQ